MGLRSLVDRLLSEHGVTPGPSSGYWYRRQPKTESLADWMARHTHGEQAQCARCIELGWDRRVETAQDRELVALRIQVQLAEQRADEAQRLAGMEGPHVTQNVPPIMVGGKGIAWQSPDGGEHTIIGSIEIDEYGEPYFVEGEIRNGS